MIDYKLVGDEFIITDYDKAKTFSSFLPSIAGEKGVPLWAFYVNRGQGMTSFGIRDKNGPIQEFFPANTSYQYVGIYGFRSFVKVDGTVYEPFKVGVDPAVKREMRIKRASFSVIETNETMGIRYKATYFGLPNDPLGAIVRKVEIENLKGGDRQLEVIDGLATLFPFGVTNGGYKEMSNLNRSWMEVYNLETQIPYYKMRTGTGDEAEVKVIDKGNFYVSFDQNSQVFNPIVDSKLVFDFDSSLGFPYCFADKSADELLKETQITANKVPCGFTVFAKSFKANETYQFATIIGHTSNYDELLARKAEITSFAYITAKEKQADEVVENITADITTTSGSPLFDEYAKQNYLDNLLRGGYPHIIKAGKNKFVYHLFSRKHGDPEREYNFFSIDPEFYSQGNGNFRDVNQNRRNDVIFNPEVGDYNVKVFMNLMQVDGYNPLGVEGSSFEIKGKDVSAIVEQCFATHKDDMVGILKGKFTPGKILNYVQNNKVELKVSEDKLFEIVFADASQNIEASFGEGYWVDHWTYNMDLIDNYLMIYPENLESMLFGDESYQYFDSPAYIFPRDEKYVVNSKGQVRQYGALTHDHEKQDKQNASKCKWLKTASGEVYNTNLMEKLVSLAVNKFTLLDPEGLGIEMEANKPGWNDAMNGLPGIFGSGMSETLELLRIVRFVKQQIATFGSKDVTMMRELLEYMKGIESILDKKLSNFDTWDQTATLREAFRTNVRWGVSGDKVTVKVADLATFVAKMEAKLELAATRALEIGKGIMPTYFYYEATDFDYILDANGNKVNSHYGLPKAKVKAFALKNVPYFLEGPARTLKVIKDKKVVEDMHAKVKASDVYDHALHMYKTSASIENESHELGRVRAFTAGWLERESIFLHMTYKYVLGLIKGGLYDEYFDDMKTNLVCFLKPEVYGRSILENSSFLASSYNPDPAVHQQGFVARLTGSTAEFLSMWVLMVMGKKGFTYENGTLKYNFAPILPDWLFTEEGTFTFNMFKHTKVTYVNKTKMSLKGDASQVKSITVDGKEIGASLEGELAVALRDGKVKEVTVVF